jgi:hypothetical protein
MAKHTKTPWKTGNNGLEDLLIVPGCQPVQAPGNSLEECSSNAEFIVRACNNHDSLLAACEMALTVINNDKSPWWIDNPDRGGLNKKQLEQAIAQAKGE